MLDRHINEPKEKQCVCDICGDSGTIVYDQANKKVCYACISIEIPAIDDIPVQAMDIISANLVTARSRGHHTVDLYNAVYNGLKKAWIEGVL